MDGGIIVFGRQEQYLLRLEKAQSRIDALKLIESIDRVVEFVGKTNQIRELFRQLGAQ